MKNKERIQWAKNAVYNCVTYLVKFSTVKITPKTLLIIKTNEIGDYVLWRNLLPCITGSQKFKNYHVTLLGSSAWKSFFEALDSSYVDEAIWIDKKLFKKNMLYRYQLQKKIRKSGFEVVVNMMASRNMREDDAFVLSLNHSFKIGDTSDDTNKFSFEKGYDKDIYDVLINTENAVFEFDKNKLFAEKLINEKLPLSLKPYINIDMQLPPALLGKKYFVVFTGSGRKEKIWPVENFVQSANHIVKKLNLIPVVCGSKDDMPTVLNFENMYKGEMVNMCGKTSLPQFANILKHAALLLSVDTGAVHIAAAVNCIVFGIFNGTRFGRFAPYPKEISSNFYSVFPDKVEEDIKNGNIAAYEGVCEIPYSDVTAEKVIKKIDAVFAIKKVED